MKAVRLTEIGKPLELKEVPIPRVGARDVLVRIRAAGICHSDAHYRAGRSRMGTLPLTLGHEIAGVVEKIGDAVTNLKIGERVCLHYNITCGDCSYCASGNEQFRAALVAFIRFLFKRFEQNSFNAGGKLAQTIERHRS